MTEVSIFIKRPNETECGVKFSTSSSNIDILQTLETAKEIIRKAILDERI